MKPMTLRNVVAVALWLGWSWVAGAMPTWMGVYGAKARHAGVNPGIYTILMNQDYVGLQAEVGVQVNGGVWQTYPMVYAGRVDGNSQWTFAPSAPYPAGATVAFYFHGFDAWGGHLWDSDGGRNYRFTVEAAGGLTFGAPVNLGALSTPGALVRDAWVSSNRAYAISGDQLNRGTVSVAGTTWGGWSGTPAGIRAIAASGAQVVMAGSSGHQVLVHLSTNNGVTFAAPLALAVDGNSVVSLDVAARGQEFLLVCTTTPNGDYPFDAHLMWSVRSVDGGRTWGAPRAVDAETMGWMDDVQVEANAAQWFVKYRYVQQAYATSIRVARSADAQTWQVATLFGDKVGSMSAMAVTPAGAFVALDPYYDRETRFARWLQGSAAWEHLPVAHPEGYASGRTVKLAAGADGVLYLFRHGIYPATEWSVSKSVDQGWTWQGERSLTPPPASSYVSLERVLGADGRVHVGWMAGSNALWQTSLKNAGGPVQWVGATRHSPTNGAIFSSNEISVAVESWPAGQGVSASIVYSTNGTQWFTLPLELAGRAGNNDRWMVNLGQFAGGSVVRYAVQVTGGDGVARWDNNGGQDYRATVNRAQLAAHAPVFASLNPYQGALDRVRVNGRSKDGNQSFGTFTAAEPLVVTARPAESSNGSAVQFAVELTSFLVYTTTPGQWGQAQIVYGSFSPGAFSNKPIFDFTTFNLGVLPPNTQVEFWLGAQNSLGSGYAQSAGQNFSLLVQ
jgi:hypothetical protein